MDNFENDSLILERMQLAIGRISEIGSEEIKCQRAKDFFQKTAEFILYVYDVCETVCNGKNELTLEQYKEINYDLYADILPENYDKSYANPEYAAKILGQELGQLLSFLYTEIRAVIAYAYEGKMEEFVSLCELFLEVYGSLIDNENPNAEYVKETIYYYMYDYADILVSGRVRDTTVGNNFAVDIINKSGQNDLSYLYSYGEYIGENEIKTAEYLMSLPLERVRAMARTFVEGFIKGFETMRIDLSPKKTVNIRYSIGQELMVREAISLFAKKGLSPVIFRYPVSRINRRLTGRVGYTATPANKQFEYDHRMDEALFFDKAFAERKLEVIEGTYEDIKEAAEAYAGPACIEVFGEKAFKPKLSENVIRLDKKQQELQVEFTRRQTGITNKYIPRDQYSFTIIAYPLPEIGDNFREIYDEIVRVNTLDNELYKNIQQSIIDELNLAEYVLVKGTKGNKTDMKVMLHRLSNPDKETNFENCLADVNIPVGEVFTSPQLTGTNGVLNVSSVYLNELRYTDLTITFEDGKIKEYTCSNFENEEENKAFIRENLMFNHDTLPIGEFAIGTNTTAYVMANKFDIVYKLPILIVEKMGPHFAVGDTCYSYSEDSILYNPDGKEIVAKDNECSILRKEDISRAYFNCHTDITIPYEEIGGIYSVHPDKSSTAIIEDGRFVLSGTEKLNEPFETKNQK